MNVSGNHWVLGVINNYEKTFDYYDSLGSKYANFVTDLL